VFIVVFCHEKKAVIYIEKSFNRVKMLGKYPGAKSCACFCGYLRGSRSLWTDFVAIYMGLAFFGEILSVFAWVSYFVDIYVGLAIFGQICWYLHGFPVFGQMMLY